MFSFLKSSKNSNKPLGYYDIKQYHSLEFALIYANEILILENENCKVFSRNYKDCTFVNVLVNEAKKDRRISIIYTFINHPKTVLKNENINLLTSNEEKIKKDLTADL